MAITDILQTRELGADTSFQVTRLISGAWGLEFRPPDSSVSAVEGGRGARKLFSFLATAVTYSKLVGNVISLMNRSKKVDVLFFFFLF